MSEQYEVSCSLLITLHDYMTPGEVLRLYYTAVQWTGLRDLTTKTTFSAVSWPQDKVQSLKTFLNELNQNMSVYLPQKE